MKNKMNEVQESLDGLKNAGAAHNLNNGAEQFAPNAYLTPERILDIVDDLTFFDEEGLVCPSSAEILKALPPGSSLKEVEAYLSALTAAGLLGVDTCKNCNCGASFYFRICSHGMPVAFHEDDSPLLN